MEGNTVDGKPIYYYGWENDVVVPEDAGQVILGCCQNCVVQNLDISNVNVSASSLVFQLNKIFIAFVS